MRVNEALNFGLKQLAHLPAPKLDTQLLLGYATDLSPTKLITEADRELTASQAELFKKLIALRETFVPIAYLTNRKAFLDIELFVDARVLVPRPETESLVAAAHNLIKEHGLKRIFEIGTGSGNIAIALARVLPEAAIVASDISEDALQVATENVKSHDLTKRIRLVKSHLAEHIEEADIVIANLPYIPQRFEVMEDILHEPAIAIFGGEDGLHLYREMFTQKIFTNFRGFAVIELGENQYQTLADWLSERFERVKVEPIRNIDGSISGLVAKF